MITALLLVLFGLSYILGIYNRLTVLFWIFYTVLLFLSIVGAGAGVERLHRRHRPGVENLRRLPLPATMNDPARRRPTR